MTERLTINFVTHDGERVAVPIKPGTNVMEAAIAHDVAGIEAQCYGAGVCGTCHVYADPPFAEILPPKTEWEEEMIAGLPLASEQSRLSCQIRFAAELDGATFRIPERQDTLG